MLESGDVRIYSRNQEDNTSKYPDIINRISKSFGSDVKSCVIDSESVAYDLEKKQIQPFQVLSTRKRKDANEAEIKVQVCVFAFDLLYLNGEVRHSVVKTGVGNLVISSEQFWILHFTVTHLRRVKFCYKEFAACLGTWDLYFFPRVTLSKHWIIPLLIT